MLDLVAHSESGVEPGTSSALPGSQPCFPAAPEDLLLLEWGGPVELSCLL